MRLKKNIALSESGFVFDPSSGDSYSLNEQAREIVELLNKDMSVEEISSAFMENYDIEKPEFERYFYDFIAMLKQYNLIESDE